MNDMFLYRLGQKRGGGSAGGGGAEEWFNDGNTHIWISLQEGRTSPMLGLGVKGTVVVDWGDGATDTLTGTSETDMQYTPIHEYGKAGDYIITLSHSGAKDKFSIYGGSYGSKLLVATSTDNDRLNFAYRNSIKRAEIRGNCNLAHQAFMECCSLKSVYVQKDSAYTNGDAIFNNCYALESAKVLGLDVSGTNTFGNCRNLRSVELSESVKWFSSNYFSFCDSLFAVSVPKSVTYIYDYAFRCCGSMAFCDFTHHEAVPTLSSTNAFSSTASDLKILVPAALVDEWKAATNWSTYNHLIVAV